MQHDRCAMLLVAAAMLLAPPPLLAAAASAKPAPRLTEEQAKQRAAAVAKVIGLPWDDTAVATFGAANWGVACHGSFLSLRGDTGQVVRCEEGWQVWREAASAATPLTESQAIAIAARAMKAFGAPPDAAFVEAHRMGPDRALWSITWRRRTATGIHYDSDVGSLLLDRTGSVQTARLMWAPSAPPASTEVRIEKARAIRIAKDLVTREHLPASANRLITAELLVVSPNDYYAAPQPRPRAIGEGAPTRVAWAVSFPRPRPGSPTTHGQRQPGRNRGADWIRDIVWVDAASAEVLGGKTAPASPPPARRWSLMPALWLAPGVLVAGLVAAAAYLARHREEKRAEEQEG